VWPQHPGKPFLPCVPLPSDFSIRWGSVIVCGGAQAPDILQSGTVLTFHWLTPLSPTPPHKWQALQCPKRFFFRCNSRQRRCKWPRPTWPHKIFLHCAEPLGLCSAAKSELLGCWLLCWSCTTTLYQNNGIIQHTLVQCYLLNFCPSFC
jgi:hypothetical protein